MIPAPRTQTEKCYCNAVEQERVGQRKIKLLKYLKSTVHFKITTGNGIREKQDVSEHLS